MVVDVLIGERRRGLGYFVKRRLYDRKCFVFWFLLCWPVCRTLYTCFCCRLLWRKEMKEVITRTRRLLALVSFPLAFVRVRHLVLC